MSKNVNTPMCECVDIHSYEGAKKDWPSVTEEVKKVLGDSKPFIKPFWESRQHALEYFCGVFKAEEGPRFSLGSWVIAMYPSGKEKGPFQVISEAIHHPHERGYRYVISHVAQPYELTMHELRLRPMSEDEKSTYLEQANVKPLCVSF